MYCSKCGKDLRDDEIFCSSCGTKVIREEQAVSKDNMEQDVKSESESLNKNPETNEEIVAEENEEATALGNNVDTNTEEISPKNSKSKKPIIIAIAAIVIIIILILMFGGNSSGNKTGDNSTTVKNSSTTIKNDDGLGNANDIAYIGRRTVDFQDATNEFRVFFMLSDSNEKPVAASGIATIVITNDNGETVYNKDIAFTPADFTTWTNAYWDSDQYMACIYIPVSNISKGTIESGKLSLKVTLNNGTYFDPYENTIYSHLPVVETKVALPSTPINLTEYKYNNEKEMDMTISNIEYEVSNSYDGDVRITFTFTVKAVKNYAGSQSSDSSHFGYKLYDSRGIIVDSGTVYNNPMATGDTTISNLYVYDLKPGETYKLELIDAK